MYRTQCERSVRGLLGAEPCIVIVFASRRALARRSKPPPHASTGDTACSLLAPEHRDTWLKPKFARFVMPCGADIAAMWNAMAFRSVEPGCVFNAASSELRVGRRVRRLAHGSPRDHLGITSVEEAAMDAEVANPHIGTMKPAL